MSGRGGELLRRAGHPARLGVIPLALIGAFAVSGCQLPQGGVSRGNSFQANSFASPTPAPQPPKPTPLAATPAVAHDVATMGPGLHLTGDPNELVGLDNATVRRALGEPLRIRNEQPAQVWQYATGDCIVDLYLYSQGGAMTVTYVEARSHTAQAEPTARCLKSLLERPTASAS